MPTYLVESYVPRPESDAAANAAALGEAGADALLRWSILLPAEDLCLHVLDGPSVDAVRAAAARAALRCQRISEVVVIAPDRAESEGGRR